MGSITGRYIMGLMTFHNCRVEFQEQSYLATHKEENSTVPETYSRAALRSTREVQSDSCPLRSRMLKYLHIRAVYWQ